jgi:hypothetical protein
MSVRLKGVPAGELYHRAAPAQVFAIPAVKA